jgi:hypothetical protein
VKLLELSEHRKIDPVGVRLKNASATISDAIDRSAGAIEQTASVQVGGGPADPIHERLGATARQLLGEILRRQAELIGERATYRRDRLLGTVRPYGLPGVRRLSQSRSAPRA